MVFVVMFWDRNVGGKPYILHFKIFFFLPFLPFLFFFYVLTVGNCTILLHTKIILWQEVIHLIVMAVSTCAFGKSYS